MELDNLPDQTKYYIPTIEEFHVGFDYEIWEKKLVYDKVWKFRVNKYMFNEKHVAQVFFNYNFIEDLKEEKIRVKYLDREDIESLGWKLTHEPTIIENKTRFAQYEKQAHESIETLEVIDSSEEGSLILIKETLNFGYTRFYGVIKNKSELKKLMNQL